MYIYLFHQFLPLMIWLPLSLPPPSQLEYHPLLNHNTNTQSKSWLIPFSLSNGHSFSVIDLSVCYYIMVSLLLSDSSLY